MSSIYLAVLPKRCAQIRSFLLVLGLNKEIRNTLKMQFTSSVGSVPKLENIIQKLVIVLLGVT